MHLQKVIIKNTKKINFCCQSGRLDVSLRYESSDQDPYQNVTDPEHW
jgi:hypothetical protein